MYCITQNRYIKAIYSKQISDLPQKVKLVSRVVDLNNVLDPRFPDSPSLGNRFRSCCANRHLLILGLHLCMELAECWDEVPHGWVWSVEGSVQSVVPFFRSVVGPGVIVLHCWRDVPHEDGVGGGEDPVLLEVGDVVCDGKGGVEDPDPGLQLRPGIQDITNGEEGKSVDRR